MFGVWRSKLNNGTPTNNGSGDLLAFLRSGSVAITQLYRVEYRDISSISHSKVLLQKGKLCMMMMLRDFQGANCLGSTSLKITL